MSIEKEVVKGKNLKDNPKEEYSLRYQVVSSQKG